MREKVLTVTIKDCKVSYFRTGGAGGQHRDKTSNGVRIIHPPSGANVTASEDRSQAANEKMAWQRLGNSPEFRRWVALEHAKRAGEIDAAVKDAMRPENLLIETYDPSGTA